MIKLRITKQGEVNHKHGHDWDKMVGSITKALNRYKDNAFHNDIDNRDKKSKQTIKKVRTQHNESGRTYREIQMQ